MFKKHDDPPGTGYCKACGKFTRPEAPFDGPLNDEGLDPICAQLWAQLSDEGKAIVQIIKRGRISSSCGLDGMM